MNYIYYISLRKLYQFILMFVKSRVSNELTRKPQGQLRLPQCASTSALTEADYFISLQVVSEFITANAIEKNNFPIDKDQFYENYVDYCKHFNNVSPVSKRNFTTYLTVFLAHRGYMLLNTKLPGRKVLWNKVKNENHPRRNLP